MCTLFNVAQLQDNNDDSMDPEVSVDRTGTCSIQFCVVKLYVKMLTEFCLFKYVASVYVRRQGQHHCCFLFPFHV